MNLELFKTLTEEQRKRYGESFPLEYTYDEKGNILTYKDSTGCWYEYTRDKQGNELTCKNSFGYWYEYILDKQGNKLTYRDSHGKTLGVSKELTITEIEKLLGYKIKVIGE